MLRSSQLPKLTQLSPEPAMKRYRANHGTVASSDPRKPPEILGCEATDGPGVKREEVSRHESRHENDA